MKQTSDYTYITSQMLADIRQHADLLRQGLLLCCVLVVIAGVLPFIPCKGEDLSLAAPAFLFFALVGLVLALCCALIIGKRLDAVQSIRMREMDEQAARLLSGKDQ